MKHDHLRFLRHDGKRTKHRPTAKHVGYRLIRTRGRKPVTDADFETVHRCAICYPVKNGAITDRRSTS